MDGLIHAETLPAGMVAECPACRDTWPLDRFNNRDPECFRCRAKTVGVSWGPAGKAFWHGTTNREYTEKTISQAKANGLDPVPAHSASVPLAGSALKKLEAQSKPLTVKDVAP